MIGQTTHHEDLDAFLDGLSDDNWAIVMSYRDMETQGVNPRLASAIDTMLSARADEAMPEAEKHEAQKRLFNLVLSATREGNDQVQVYTDRIWGRLSPDERRQLATNSTLAPSIIMEAMRNDPLLAPRIVVQIDQTTTRGIEAYQGIAAAGGIGMHYASLREQDSARAAEARQFADLGISRADAAVFSSIGLDRTLFDRYLRDGFSHAQILSGARDANALGFRGREDIDIAMNAPPELRAAAVAIMRAKTPEEKEAARRHYLELRERLQQQYPPGDPRRDHLDNFDNRFQKVNGAFLDHAARNSVETTLAMSQEERVEASRRAIGGQEFDRIQTAIAERREEQLATTDLEDRAGAMFAGLGLDPAPTQQAAAQPDSTPTVTAEAPPVEGEPTHIAAAEATPTAVTPASATVTADANPAGATPMADNQTRVARAPVRLPSAMV